MLIGPLLGERFAVVGGGMMLSSHILSVHLLRTLLLPIGFASEPERK